MRQMTRTGVPIVDGCLGGVPTGQLTLVLGKARTGKTLFALGALVGALRRSETVCFVGADEPGVLLETCMVALEFDLRPALRSKQLTWLTYGPNFDAKLGSLADVRPAMDEVERVARVRGVGVLIVDPADPVTAVGEAHRARSLARAAVECLRQTERTCFVTVDPDQPGAIEWRAACPTVFELAEHQRSYSLTVVRSRVADLNERTLPVELVAGEGLMAPWQVDTTWELDALGGDIQVVPRTASAPSTGSPPRVVPAAAPRAAASTPRHSPPVAEPETAPHAQPQVAREPMGFTVHPGRYAALFPGEDLPEKPRGGG